MSEKAKDGAPRRTGRPHMAIAGVALIEALIALAVIVAGSAAIFGIQSYVMGTSAESRLNTVAMSLAQEKIEEFRNWDFDELEADSDSPPAVLMPGIALTSVELDRCWAFDAVPNPADVTVNIDGLLRANVAVVRGGQTCDPEGPGLAQLSTLIAESDPRLAGRQFAGARRSDGEGEVVSDYTPEGDSRDQVDLPSGFTEDRDDDGNLLAVYTPLDEEGVASAALVSGSGDPLKYAEISGNIVFKGDRRGEDLETSYAGLVDIGTEGAAICRLYFNGTGTVGWQAGTTVEGDTLAGYTYLQYSCVVANQWRRSIFLKLPVGSSDQVCVGHPKLQDLADATAAEGEVAPDILAAAGRAYWGQTLAGEELVDAGMRGTSDGLSRIGSVLPPTSASPDRGWVPGGHHFFITEGSAQTCAEAMRSTRDMMSTEEIGMVLFRNPQRLYCTSTKDLALSDLALTVEATEEETLIEGSGCLASTRVSGFVPSGITSGVSAEIAAFPYVSGTFDPVTCDPDADPLSCDVYWMECGEVIPGNKAFLCDFRGDNAKARVMVDTMNRIIPPLTLPPTAALPDAPIETLGEIPHDAVLEDF